MELFRFFNTNGNTHPPSKLCEARWRILSRNLQRVDVFAVISIGFIGGVITSYISIGVGEILAVYLIFIFCKFKYCKCCYRHCFICMDRKLLSLGYISSIYARLSSLLLSCGRYLEGTLPVVLLGCYRLYTLSACSQFG